MENKLKTWIDFSEMRDYNGHEIYEIILKHIDNQGNAN